MRSGDRLWPQAPAFMPRETCFAASAEHPATQNPPGHDRARASGRQVPLSRSGFLERILNQG